MLKSDIAILPALGGTEFSAAAAGRKATPLHELMGAGFAVPPGFVVPPDVPLDARLQAQLDAAVTAIGGYPVAARSSGHLEDLPGASFAGQYVTRLEITDARGLLEAVEECRASARSPQVTAYLRKNGLDESQARFAPCLRTKGKTQRPGAACLPRASARRSSARTPRAPSSHCS